MAYFTNFPEIQYDIKKDAKLTQIDDLFVRYRIREQVKNEMTLYYNYDIKDWDTPELLANQIYDDPHLYWIILKMNDIVNVNEDWPKTQRQLNKFVDSKYPGKALMVSGLGTSDFTIGEDVTTIEGYISLEDFFDTAADAEPRLKYERSDVENYMVQEAIDNPATGIINSIDKTNFNIGSKTNPTHKVIITEADGTFSNGDVITGRNSDTTATIISTVANTDADHHFEDENNNYVDADDLTRDRTVTNRVYEDEKNETKRNIKILHPDFVGSIVDEFESILEVS